MATGEALERARPQERALAEIAKQLPEGVVQQSPSGITLINFAHPELNRRCIVLAPAATMARTDPNFTPAIHLVYINPDPEAGDVYPIEKDKTGKPKTLALTKVGLRKLGDKAGVEQLRPDIQYDGKNVTVGAAIRVRQADGVYRPYYESQNWIYEDEYEAVVSECPEKWGRGDNAHRLTEQEKKAWIAKRWAQVRKSNLRMTESKALNAAYREALPGLQQKYLPEEFWFVDDDGNRQPRPFLVQSNMFTPDTSDIRVLKMLMTGGEVATGMLYGSQSAAPSAALSDDDGVIDLVDIREDPPAGVNTETGEISEPAAAGEVTHGEMPTEDVKIPRGPHAGKMLSELAKEDPGYTKKTFASNEQWGPVEEQWRRYWHGEEDGLDGLDF